MLCFIIGLFLGGVVALVTMALLIAGKECDADIAQLYAESLERKIAELEEENCKLRNDDLGQAIRCPETDGRIRPKMDCVNCIHRDGCPAYE